MQPLPAGATDSNGRLVFERVATTDRGDYVCRATDGDRVIEERVTLNVASSKIYIPELLSTHFVLNKLYVLQLQRSWDQADVERTKRRVRIWSASLVITSVTATLTAATVPTKPTAVRNMSLLSVRARVELADK